MQASLAVALLFIRSSHAMISSGLHTKAVMPTMIDRRDESRAGGFEETIVFLHHNYDERSRVKVVGSWSKWTTLHPMGYTGSSCWFVNLELSPGLHEFRFVVDGRWELSVAHPSKISYARQGEFVAQRLRSSLFCSQSVVLAAISSRREATML